MATADTEDLSDSLEAGIEDDEDTEDTEDSEGDNEGENRRRIVELRASASVPLFGREERPGLSEELGGSETELNKTGLELGEPGLELAQSYAGKYVPAISYKIHQEMQALKQKDPQNYRKNKHFINFRGMAIGDGLCDPVTMTNYGDFLFNIGLIDEQV